MSIIYIYIYNIYKKLNLVSTWKEKNCLILTKIGTKLNKNNEYRDSIEQK